LAGVFYNTSGLLKCFNISQGVSPSLGIDTWDYQACTEMILPVGADGVNDMFLPQPWDLQAYTKYCNQKYEVESRPFWIPLAYGTGAFNISASNIIFSNGLLDPWSGGGITAPIPTAPSIVTILIEEAAHHLDLRSSNPNDPQAVVKARELERKIIADWLTQS